MVTPWGKSHTKVQTRPGRAPARAPACRELHVRAGLRTVVLRDVFGDAGQIVAAQAVPSNGQNRILERGEGGMTHSERHIGRAGARSHLALMEHGIFTRLLDVATRAAIPDAGGAADQRRSGQARALQAVLNDVLPAHDFGRLGADPAGPSSRRFQESRTRLAECRDRWSAPSDIDNQW